MQGLEYPCMVKNMNFSFTINLSLMRNNMKAQEPGVKNI